MRAVCWHGKQDVRVERVPDPGIVNPRDAIIEVTSTAICGSDLHLYDGVIPTMQDGDVLGHEFMGRVVDVGSAVKNLTPGDRVVVPFNIACGGCWHCKHDQQSLCDNSNPSGEVARKAYGQAPAGLFGYSHMMGGFAGGQAEYVRVPFADYGPLKVPDELPDDQVLFLSDIFPTGWQAAKQCDIREGDSVAVWGCGPVGQFAIRSAKALGAGRIFAIDRYVQRLSMAGEVDGVELIHMDEDAVHDVLLDLTGGRGPDACIDAVGLEAYGHSVDALYDRVKMGLGLATDRGHALRQAILACRKGGTVSIPGVYGGVLDKFPVGAMFGKALTLRGGQTNVHRYMGELLEHVRSGRIDPSFVITHRMPLAQAAEGYDTFKREQDRCIKVVLHT